VIDPKQVQVTATVPIADAGRFTVGAAARAIAADKGSGELLHVAARPQPEAGAKTIAVTLEFDTPTELTPGTQVAIEIDAEQRSNVPLVPAIAVLKDDPNNPVVVVASGNVAMRRPVRIGLVDAQHAEIQSGLKPGELIITQGQSSLRDGAPITISTP
jgi:RND family efflux transporter MFP subunit